ncbi:hypothetical protein GCM10011319_13850 [Mameliella alba]|nr:hypothetical protein GCM10011319_13850 [Mameliella alba]
MEGFFAKLTRRRHKHGVFHSVIDLQAAINRFIAEYSRGDEASFFFLLRCHAKGTDAGMGLAILELQARHHALSARYTFDAIVS